MPKQVAAVNRVRGLVDQYNATGAPAGSLKVANNVTADKENTLSKRRGFTRLLEAGNLGDSVFWFGQYFDEGRFLRVRTTASGSDLEYFAGSWTAITNPAGAEVEPPGGWEQSPGYRLRTAEIRRSLYFCTATGIGRLSSSTAWLHAGQEPGLDLAGSLVFDAGGDFLRPDKQVAYRVLFGYEDAKGKEVVGKPTWREIIANPAFDVTWSRSTTTATITQTGHGYSNSDIIEITETSDATALPLGEYAISNVMTDTYDITVPNAGGTSGTARAGKGAQVELSFTIPQDTQERRFYEVYRTPLSGDLASDPGDTMKRVRRVYAQLTAQDEETFTDARDPAFLDTPLYTNANEEGAANANDILPLAYDVAVFRGHTFYVRTRYREALTIHLNDVGGIVDGTDTITLEATTTETYTFESAETIASDEFKRFTSEATDAQNIEKTMKSFCRVVNRQSTQFRAYYDSGADDPPGRVVIQWKDYADETFSVWSSVGDSNFEEELPTSDTGAFASDPDDQPNRILYSKFERPDAVPRGNLFRPGRESDAAVRALALNDALVIFKSIDGVYTITGDDPTTFVLDEASRSVRLRGPETAVVLDDTIYCLSNQGVVRVDESGEAAIVSRDIDNRLRPFYISSSNLFNQFATAHEEDKAYVLVLPTEPSGGSRQVFRYNFLNNTWVRWPRFLQGIGTYKLSTGDTIVASVTEEPGGDRAIIQRGLTDPTPYREEERDATIDGLTTTGGITTADVSFADDQDSGAPAVGWVLTQGATSAKITAVTLTAPEQYDLVLDGDYSGTLSAAACTLAAAVVSEITWFPLYGDNAALQKQWLEAHVYVEENRAETSEIGFASNKYPTLEYVGAHTVAAGLGSQPMRSHVPTKFQRSEALEVSFRSRWADEYHDILQMAAVYRPISERSNRAPRTA